MDGSHHPPPLTPNPTPHIHHPQIQPKIGFNCVKPVLTVVSFLEERGALSLLQDARVMIATRDITDRGGRRSREEVRGVRAYNAW